MQPPLPLRCFDRRMHTCATSLGPRCFFTMAGQIRLPMPSQTPYKTVRSGTTSQPMARRHGCAGVTTGHTIRVPTRQSVETQRRFEEALPPLQALRRQLRTVQGIHPASQFPAALVVRRTPTLVCSAQCRGQGLCNARSSGTHGPARRRGQGSSAACLNNDHTRTTLPARIRSKLRA
jgi:hypothetical protein